MMQTTRVNLAAVAHTIQREYKLLRHSRIRKDGDAFVVAVHLREGSDNFERRIIDGKHVHVHSTSSSFNHLLSSLSLQPLGKAKKKKNKNKRRNTKPPPPPIRMRDSRISAPPFANYSAFAHSDLLTRGHEEQLQVIEMTLQQRYKPMMMERIGSTEKGTALGSDFDVDYIALVSHLDDPACPAAGRPRRATDPNFRLVQEHVHNRKVDLLITSNVNVYEQEKEHQRTVRAKLYARRDVRIIQEVVRSLKKARSTTSSVPTSFMCIKLAMNILPPGYPSGASGFLECVRHLANPADLKRVLDDDMWIRYDVSSKNDFAHWRKVEEDLCRKGFF